MGHFKAGKPKPRSPIRFAPSPGPSARNRPVVSWPLNGQDIPQLIVTLEGQCIYASQALARLLQCGVHELYGDGWRPRLSPYAGSGPFNPENAMMFARSKAPIRLESPCGTSAIVTRIRTVTDPQHPERVTGFYGRVQVVRVHRRRAAASEKSA